MYVRTCFTCSCTCLCICLVFIFVNVLCVCIPWMMSTYYDHSLVHTQVAKERIRVLEFLRDYDKLAPTACLVPPSGEPWTSVGYGYMPPEPPTLCLTMSTYYHKPDHFTFDGYGPDTCVHIVYIRIYVCTYRIYVYLPVYSGTCL